ncbi:hypothetical protein JZ751_001630 [Albula glossodonta]|uniref:Uncharacterized protein n=1 Tax=Albula glossodonta TaxID=121402 RepID=A0A8T2PU06_9TELE|nr:hypothetical protein JZ751_001630 [Albula glossodonta]
MGLSAARERGRHVLPPNHPSLPLHIAPLLSFDLAYAGRSRAAEKVRVTGRRAEPETAELHSTLGPAGMRLKLKVLESPICGALECRLTPCGR